MGRFFTSWEIWEKLVFLLACAIVITIVLGGIKLVYTHRKLRKYTRLSEEEKKANALRRNLSLSYNRPRQDAIPFGIRAIESGIEVEGVWISREHTPEPETSRSASSSHASLPHAKDIESAAQNHQAKNAPPLSSRPSPQSSSERSQIPGMGPKADTDIRAAPEVKAPQAVKKRQYPPLKYSKYRPATQDSAARARPESDVVDRLEAASRDTPGLLTRRRSKTLDENVLSSDFVREASLGPGDSIDVTAPRQLPKLSREPRKRDPNEDFDLMQLHRSSQAAEIGQLTPRLRNLEETEHSDALSSPSAGLQLEPQTASYTEQGESIILKKLPSLDPDRHCANCAPQQLRRSQAREEWAMLHEPTSAAAQQSAPLSLDGNVLRVEPIAVKPSDLLRSEQHSFDVLDSPVLRGHGTGFEILKPGTFRTSAPPVSLQNHNRRRSSSSEQRRKLQKKRRSSAGSIDAMHFRRRSRSSTRSDP